ncbi:MAG: type IV secretory system conjugative DNA transfer family protein [Minwuia sp.]|nr:type IV secretory system conjugative DNA transfer family protein [Minwuia sp.]
MTGTLEFDDTLQQNEARERKRDARRNVLRGGDPFEEGRKFAHFARASSHRTQQARALMTPEEVLAVPEDRQILFISGKNLKPIYAAKYPYYSRPEMAGHYLPNPYRPPADQVPIRERERGRDRWRRVITAPVPARYASFPQYPEGIWSYVEGFKP